MLPLLCPCCSGPAEVIQLFEDDAAEVFVKCVPPASVPQDDHDPRIDPRPGDNLEVVEKDDFENTSSAHHYRVLCVVEDHVGYKLYGAAWRGFMHLPAWQEKMKAATVMKVPEGNLQPKSSVPQETTEGVKRGD